MNKDLDERLVPKGEYREAQNILITQSEGSDVGAIENIEGNALAIPMPTITGDLETIGYFADTLNKKVYWFITDFTGDDGDVRTMSRAQSSNTCQILMADLNNTSEEAKIIVKGHFLNFSKNHLITGVNLIDDLLFFTDNYNQPRKINVTRAEADNTYYTKEEQISVAKVVPYLAPILHNSSGQGDDTTITNNSDITSDYLKDRFVRFSYRYKYEDGEYTTMAPFTQIVFKPLNEGQINNIITTGLQETDVQDVYSKTIVDIMKNHYNQVEVRIPLPGDEYQTDSSIDWNNELRITKLEILIKESDQDVVKVVKEIDVNNNDSFTSLLETRPIMQDNIETIYYRHVYKYVYKSEEPYKILEDKQITRVFDQVPLRAKSQEISGNRVIYGNFTENYELPTDSDGKSGINYVINTTSKGDTAISSILNNNPQYNKSVYKNHSIKQKRKYQVGVVLIDKFGRQSPVILSTSDVDTVNIPAETRNLSDLFENNYSWANNHETIGKALSITFNDNTIVDQVYEGDIDNENYNPYGWYSYKIVVKQQEQEYYNIYTNHPADNWNNESNGHDEVLGFTWISLYGNNINKIPRDVSEVDEIREGVAGSDALVFPKVVKANNSFANQSVQGIDQDFIEVMTIGTAREQGILTRDDRDKDRVHDFVMAKRNPLLAQVKSIGANNRVRYRIDANVKETNSEDKTQVIIGDGNTVNPYIRAGHEVTINQTRGLKHISNIGKKVLNVKAKSSEQDSFESKTITLNGSEINNSGGDAKIEVGQIIEFRNPFSTQTGGGTITLSALPTLTVAQDSTANENHFTTLSNDVFYPFFEQMLFDAYNQGFNAEPIYGISGSGTLPVSSGPPTLDVFKTVNENYTVINGVVSGSAPPNPVIYWLEDPSYFNVTMSQLQLVHFGTAQNLEDNVIGGKTTATIEEHGDHFNIRRPILQKVELNQKENRSILHFDRNIFENVGINSPEAMFYLAMFDPITIKSVETITETVDGVLKYFQKIKLSHEVFFNEGDHIVIQNLETEPISVTTGLTVLETNPVESNLEIYFESSTSGLITDLHADMIAANASKEIAYFNTFILTGGGDETTNTPGVYHIEESRIKGEFNGKSVDFGVRAHLVDDEYAQRIRGNALIHSGIFNAKTKVNETNQFSIGENITKAVDIQNGSIQKLYAEDTNLIIFQENKVNRALIDKDAIFTQEGQPLTTASKVVIGQIASFAGKYGISKNPESFAVYGGRKYFSDKNRGVILRLSQDGLTPISDAGMRSFFRDNLQNAIRVYGMYDEQKNKYVVSMQNNDNVPSTYIPEYGNTVDSTIINKDDYATLSYDERSRGWVSFYTYKPTFGFSISNQFYTYNLQNLYQHYRDDVQRCMFYKSSYTDPANVEFVFNDQPTTVKNFHTIDYEGTTGWKMASAETDMHVAYPILDSGATVSSLSIPVNFVNKENKYYGHIRNNTTTTALNQIVGVDLSGIKGYFNKVKMQYWKPSEAIASSIDKGELYAVGSETVYSSQ